MLTVISGLATALSPIIHGGDSRGGTLTEFRREKVIVDGRIELLPIISGNSVRGLLRDACALFSLDAAGIKQLKDLRSFHLLFGGGALTKVDSESYVNLAEERKLRELLPVVSLFGGSVGNRILGGRLDVGEWVPVCREAASLLPDDLQPLARVSIYDLLDIISFTRRDDTRSRNLQGYLDPDTLAIYQQRKAVKQESEEAEEAGASQQMRYSYEVLSAGTQFAVEFVLHDVSEVEMGTFLGGLALFATCPRIGGRASTGLGKVKLDLKQVRIGEPVKLVSEIAPGAIETARQHITERRADILALLEG